MSFSKVQEQQFERTQPDFSSVSMEMEEQRLDSPYVDTNIHFESMDGNLSTQRKHDKSPKLTEIKRKIINDKFSQHEPQNGKHNRNKSAGFEPKSWVEEVQPQIELLKENASKLKQILFQLRPVGKWKHFTFKLFQIR